MGESGSNPWSINSPRLTLLLVLKKNTHVVSLKKRFENSRDSQILKLRINTLESPNLRSTLYNILV